MIQNDLYKVFTKLNTKEEVELFLIDLLTPQERDELSRRWAAAKMLNQQLSYLQIEKETGLSSTTIARVSKALKEGGGYSQALKKEQK